MKIFTTDNFKRARYITKNVIYSVLFRLKKSKGSGDLKISFRVVIVISL